MNRRLFGRLFLTILCVGALLRTIAWYIEPPQSSDEFLHYIEPAWSRISGVGVSTWEWRNGTRSWVLPGYNGAWLSLLSFFGLRGAQLVAPVQLHWACISLLLVWAGWRGGKLLSCQVTTSLVSTAAINRARTGASAPFGWQGGLLGAAFCSTFPMIVLQAPHTSSETPSMLALVWSLVLALESVETRSTRSAALSGFLAALGVCFRIANGPLALVPIVVLVAARGWRLLLWFALTCLVPIVLFGLVDLFTWGGFLASHINDVRSSYFGYKTDLVRQPADWYWRTIIDRLPTWIAIFAFVIFKWRKFAWPYLVSSFGLLVYLTTQPHKEERFIVQFWPYFLIAVAGTVGGWLSSRSFPSSGEPISRIESWFLNRVANSNVQLISMAFIILFVFVDSLLHSGREAFDWSKSVKNQTVSSRGLLQAQDWVGKRKDLAGAIIEHEALGGGYAWYGSTAPLIWFNKSFKHSLVRNPVLNYAIVMHLSPNVELITSAGYTQVRSFGNYDVFRKPTRDERR